MGVEPPGPDPRALDPETSATDAALARAHGGDVEGALVSLRQLVAANAEDQAAWIGLGTVLLDAARWGEARDALARAVDLDSQVLLARMLYARALERVGKLDDAVFQLLRAAQQDASHAGLLRELGSLFYKKGLYDKALQWLLKATAAAASSADVAEQARALYAVGLAQEARRDPGAAIAAYREAIRLDPKHLDARKTLADALAAIGEHAQAIQVLDELLRFDRTNEGAAANREVLERALAEMRTRRLIGKTLHEVEISALVQAGRMKRRDRTLFGLGPPEDPKLARFGNEQAELHAVLPDDRIITELFFVLLHPDRAGAIRDAVYEVTVVAEDGRREPATFATAASVTFLREALGVPMTQAAELYARLLGGERSVEFGGLEARFEARDAGGKGSVNGLLVALRR